MKPLRCLMLLTSLVLAAPGYSDEAADITCPDVKNVYFYPLIANFAGYWGGKASDGTQLQSGNYVIPFQVQKNGFDIFLDQSSNNPQNISCSYYLQDRVTGIKSPVFTLISNNKQR